MKFSAQQIAELLQGKVEGNPEVEVNKLAKIEEGEINSLSFLANDKYAHYVYTTDASIVIVNNDFQLEQEVKDTCTLIRVENAYECFAQLLEVYDQYTNNKSGIEQPSFIAESAKIGENPYVGAFAYVSDSAVIGDNVKIYPHAFVGENAVIGDNTTLFSGVKVYRDSLIGKDCILHAGTIIGADGFGFVPKNDKNYKKIPQLGNVIIEDDVEIGANCCIDKATLGSTIIKQGTKLDNLIQIGHNSIVGENTVIVSQTGIAGSTTIGKNCMIAGQVGIIGHLKIGDGAKIAAQSGVTRNIEENGIVQGSPAYAIKDYTKSYAGFKNLPSLIARVNELEKNKK